jgi:hypothetical protein
MTDHAIITNACQNLYSRGLNDEAGLVRSLAARIRGLEAELQELRLQYLSDAGQADERYGALHEAVELALKKVEGANPFHMSNGYKKTLRDILAAALSTHNGVGNE